MNFFLFNIVIWFQSYDFILYAGLMTLDMLFFVFLAARYKYVKQPTMEEDKPHEEHRSSHLSIKEKY